MKLIVIFSILLLSISACTKKVEVVKSPLDGAWEVIFAQINNGDSVVWQTGVNATGGETKIWSGNYFNYVGVWKLNDSTVYNYGGGTFKLEGNRYVENVQYPEVWSANILLEIKGDTITQTWPIDENGQVIKKTWYVEKFKRKV